MRGADTCPDCAQWGRVVSSFRVEDLWESQAPWLQRIRGWLHGIPCRVRRFKCPNDHKWWTLEFRARDLNTLFREE